MSLNKKQLPFSLLDLGRRLWGPGENPFAPIFL
jgi:hypothetical protein